MALFASPKLALKRGALLTAANWQVVVLQWVADSVFTALLAVPVVGGAALVVLTSDLAPQDLFDQGLRRAVPAVAAALLAHPIALAAFLAAMLVVLLGGALFMAFVKGGTIAVLALAEGEAGPIEHPPLHLSAVGRTGRFRLETATAGAQRLFGRFARLGVGLFVAYGLIGTASLATVVSLGTPDSAWDAARIFAVTVAVIVAVTVVNLLYLLMQIAVAVDDCDAGTAVARTTAFLVRRPCEVGIVFGVVSTLVALGTAASFLATAALGLIAFVPFVGLAALPLQVGAWMVRGLVFQFLGLTALVAYLRLYREGGGTGA
ncbi:MAG: hypothetical protein JNL48_01365 [Acidobacteria bacterium]|nr:hypothetical protein [Acidobacteriota bacterium]